MKNKTILNYHYNALRLQLIRMYGSKCARCGIKDIRVLDFNHKIPVFISKEKREEGGSKKYYLEIKNNPEKFELLCKNCNYLHYREYRDKINKEIIEKAKKLYNKGYTYFYISKRLHRSQSWIKQRVKPYVFTSLEDVRKIKTEDCSICEKYFGNENNILRERFHSSKHRAKQCVNIHKYGKFDGKF